MKKTTSIFVSSIIVALVVVAIILWNKKSDSTSINQVFNNPATGEGTNNTYNSMSSTTINGKDFVDLSKISNENLSEAYKNPTYNFSLNYPAGLKVSTFPNSEGAGDYVLIADNKTGIGMQIFISPFDEPASVFTVERIKKDAPSLIINNPKSFSIGSGNGVAFFDSNEANANRQVWFVVGKYLYQITAPNKFDSILQKILNTWKFEE